MGKGEETRAAILDSGMQVAASEGLDAITIGRLADRVGMSKSGLFAHFRSKEALQIGVLEHSREVFIDRVIKPSLDAARGLPRLRALFDRWLVWNVLPATDEVARNGSDWPRFGGCVFLQAAAEFDDREDSDVRAKIVATQKEMIQFLIGATELAIQQGHFKSDVEPDQLAFEMYALVMAYHFHARLLGDERAPARTQRAFERLLSSVMPH